MNRELIQNIIEDALSAYKYPDGTLKDEEEIINEYVEKWDEEFEDELEVATDGVDIFGELRLKEKYLLGLVETYLGISDSLDKKDRIGKVKIKVRKGKIVIERIK